MPKKSRGNMKSYEPVGEEKIEMAELLEKLRVIFNSHNSNQAISAFATVIMANFVRANIEKEVVMEFFSTFFDFSKTKYDLKIKEGNHE